MNIIFKTENAERLYEKYTVLELDTFKFLDQDEESIAYCVVEMIPLDEMPETPKLKEQHAALIESFKTQQWDECLNLIDTLRGKWGGDLDSYYENLQDRVEEHKKNPRSEDWSHVIIK